jgi:hypothetical protein
MEEMTLMTFSYVPDKDIAPKSSSWMDWVKSGIEAIVG